MALEKPSYRDNLERIKEKYPDKELLSPIEVAEFCGICSKTARKWFSFNKHCRISVATLAREMS